MAPTPAATGTVNPGAGRGGSAGSGDGGAQVADVPPGSLLVWGLVALAMLAFSMFMILFTRRPAREEQQRASAPPAQRPARAGLNQPHQALPMRQDAPSMLAADTAKPPLEKGHIQMSLLPSQELHPPTTLTPPRWLIDSGLLKEGIGELPAEDSQGW